MTTTQTSDPVIDPILKIHIVAGVWEVMQSAKLTDTGNILKEVFGGEMLLRSRRPRWYQRILLGYEDTFGGLTTGLPGIDNIDDLPILLGTDSLIGRYVRRNGDGWVLEENTETGVVSYLEVVGITASVFSTATLVDGGVLLKDMFGVPFLVVTDHPEDFLEVVRIWAHELTELHEQLPQIKTIAELKALIGKVTRLAEIITIYQSGKREFKNVA